MTYKKRFLFCILLLCQIALAQNDTIVQLQEVIITDTQLRDFSNSQSVQTFNDSVIRNNPASLTSLLNYNTVIYFKENGLGMVSSPSFRGTTAQQTAVIWNGININSQLNGQTDFYTLTARDFSSVAVRAGGGSVIYGSSAIGGSIHLNNEPQFGNRMSNEARVEYGSFNALGINYNATVSRDKFAANISISRNSSDNDYDYPGWDMKNENGQYYNTAVNTAFAYKINSGNTLKLYSYVFDGERHFSGTLAAPSRSKYQDTNTRNLLEWAANYNRFTSKLKLAYITENYKYFENHENDNHTFGNVNTYIAKYDLAYTVTDGIRLNAIIDYMQNNGEGSDIEMQKRNTGSASLLMKHEVTDKFAYESGIRKEVSDVYASPVLFSFGTNYAIAKFYTIKLNASRNYRIPTFNDLYWQGSSNPDLKAESSYQAELGNEFKLWGATLTLTGYYIKLRDMLRWIPQGSVWSPENAGKVNTYGAESVFNWQKQAGNSRFEVNGTYAYTVSREDGKDEQLIYVPFSKATASIGYSYKNISAWYRYLYNGKVFFTSDNESEIKAYDIVSFGAQYRLNVLQGLDIGVQVLNALDKEYQNVTMRPMPGRNYNMYLNLKF